MDFMFNNDSCKLLLNPSMLWKYSVENVLSYICNSLIGRHLQLLKILSTVVKASHIESSKMFELWSELTSKGLNTDSELILALQQAAHTYKILSDHSYESKNGNISREQLGQTNLAKCLIECENRNHGQSLYKSRDIYCHQDNRQQLVDVYKQTCSKSYIVLYTKKHHGH